MSKGFLNWDSKLDPAIFHDFQTEEIVVIQKHQK